MHRIDSSRSIRASALQSFEGRESAGTIPPEVCELCFSDLVQPVDAKASSGGTVRLTLRCPECHHVRVGECSWEEAREFGRHFAKGKATLRGHYEKLSDENFRDELDCLVLALHTDLIGPDDFAPYRYST
ncbi:MAG: hypothetical protein ACRDKE_01790 [Solirubrobacterales bacterium]